MNEELRIKNDESRKRAHILHYSLFILHYLIVLHYSLFILHYLIVLHYSLFILHYLIVLHYSLFILHYPLSIANSSLFTLHSSLFLT